MVIGCLLLSDASAICRIVNVRRTSQKIRGSFLFLVLPWPCILPLWLFISFFSFFFFFFFSTPNLGGHWTDLYQTGTHNYLLMTFKNLAERAGSKNRFLGPTLKFGRTYFCNGIWYQQPERNLSIYRDSPTCPPNLANFGPETAENGWWVFAHPLNSFALGDTAILTALTLYNRHHANFGTSYVVARAYSLYNVGRAHVGLCHAYSCLYFGVLCLVYTISV